MFYSTTSPKPEDKEQDRGLIGLLLLSRWFEKVFCFFGESTSSICISPESSVLAVSPQRTPRD